MLVTNPVFCRKAIAWLALVVLAAMQTCDADEEAADAPCFLEHKAEYVNSCSTDQHSLLQVGLSIQATKGKLQNGHKTSENHKQIFHKSWSSVQLPFSSTGYPDVHDTSSSIYAKMTKMMRLRARHHFAVSGLLTVVALAMLGVACRIIVGFVILWEIEAFLRFPAHDLLGVDIHFDYIYADYFATRVHVGKLVICNPTAAAPSRVDSYTTPYLLKAKEVIIDVNMMKLLCTFMSTVEVTKLVVQGVHINYERRALTSGKSNVEEVRDCLRKSIQSKLENAEQSPVEERHSFIIRNFYLLHAGSEAKIKGASSPLTLSPLKKEDFCEDCCGTDIEDVAVALVDKIAESILSSASGLEQLAQGILSSVEKDAPGLASDRSRDVASSARR
mmetsp:Transcript_70997/g.123139  ORF Transcript_70997/g.123139 Transcript_70997/m.123139 type:complete len:388 (-) Transcript_70997:25-1188(-)